MDAELADDYRPLDSVDTAELARGALSLAQAESVSGPAEVWRDAPFADSTRALARGGRLASGAVEPGPGPWFLREGVHLAPALRLLVFPRALPPRAVVRLESSDARRLFPLLHRA